MSLVFVIHLGGQLNSFPADNRVRSCGPRCSSPKAFNRAAQPD